MGKTLHSRKDGRNRKLFAFLQKKKDFCQRTSFGTNLFHKMISLFFLLAFLNVAFAQQLELNNTSYSTATTGTLQTTGPATFLKNTGTSTTFNAYSPTTTYSVSISNQQYTSGALPGVTIGYTSTGVFQPVKNGVGSGIAASNYFTSSPNSATSGTNFNTTDNYGFMINVEPGYQKLTSQPLNARNYYADMTVTFNRPVVNPVLHFCGIGKARSTVIAPPPSNFYLGDEYQGFYSEFELSSNNINNGISLTRLSGDSHFSVVDGNKIVNSNTLTTSTASNWSSLEAFLSGGSVRINSGGVPITSVTFRIYLRGDGGTNVTGYGAQWPDMTVCIDDFTLSVSLGMNNLSGTVYQDNDGMIGGVNGTVMSGVGVGLYDNTGSNLLASTITNASGYYEFLDIAAGSYVVKVTPPLTYASVSSTDATPTDGQTNVVIDGINNTSSVDFGLFQQYTACEFLNNGTFTSNLNGWVAGTGWAQNTGRARNAADNISNQALTQTISALSNGTAELSFELSALNTGSTGASLAVLLNGTTYVTFNNPNTTAVVTATTQNGATISWAGLTAGNSTFARTNVTITIPYSGPQNTNLSFVFTAAGANADDYEIDNVSLKSICPVNITGTVFNDNNINTRIDIGESGTNTGADLFVYLVNASGLIVDSAKVNSNGTFTLDAAVNQNYQILLSKAQYTIGTTPVISTTTPAGWVTTGENGSGNNTGSGDGTPDGILSVTVGTTNVTQQNFGIYNPGYIYVHKKAADENSTGNFQFSISGGPTPVGNFTLNDDPAQIPVNDIGSSSDGTLWAVGTNNILYYRSAGSSVWVATSVTNAVRVDGGVGSTAYVVTSSGSLVYFDGTTSSTLATSGVLDVGSAWDNRPYVAGTNGWLYRYSGTGSSALAGTSWPRYNTNATSLTRVDGDPSNPEVPVYVSAGGDIYKAQSGTTNIFLGRPANTSGGSFDVAVDNAGNIYSIYMNPGGGGTFPYKWISGTSWTSEENVRSIANITGGVGNQIWAASINNTGAGYATNIFTRSNNGTNIVWIDDERINTASTGTNSILIPVMAGTYTLTELVTAGWDLFGLSVSDPSSNSSFNLLNRNATINVGQGEIVNVIFKNGFINPFAMTNNCAAEYKEDFGTGPVNTFGNALTGQTTYHFNNSAVNGADGYYKVIGNTSQFASWAVSFNDHTSNNGQGRMLAVNASFDFEDFFRRRFTGLVPGATYDFSAWLASFSNDAVKPNATFLVVDSNKNVLTSYNSGNINTAGVWNKYGFTFTATTTSVDLIIRNNATGGGGNDIAIDDITFKLIPPTIPVTTVTNASCSTGGVITITSPLGASYEYSVDGTNWQSSPVFNNLAGGIHTVSARFAGTINCFTSQFDTINLLICGTIFNDVNGNTRIDGSEAGTSANSNLYVYLVNTSGVVVDSSKINPDGTYTLDGFANTNYIIELSTVQYPIGHNTNTTPINHSLPAGWINTGENGAGNIGSGDGLPDGVLAISTGSVNLTQQNFAITPAGYIYVHKKALNETASINFPFTVAGGATQVPAFTLNDNPIQMRILDLGSSQNGTLWAVGRNNTTLYYRQPNSTVWVATSITDASRVDGDLLGNAVYVNTAGTAFRTDGVTTTQISAVGAFSTTADIASGWDGLPYISSGNIIYRYSGTGTTWNVVTNQSGIQSLFSIDVDTVSKDVFVVSRNVSATPPNRILRVSPTGVVTNIGAPTGTAATVPGIRDIAVTSTGEVFITAFNITNDGWYVFRYNGTSWSSREEASFDASELTGGVGGQLWTTMNSGGQGPTATTAPYYNIFSRALNGTSIFYIDDERLRTSTGNSIVIPVIPGNYTLTEGVSSGWDLQNIFVYDPTSNSSSSLTARTATLNVSAGEMVHATFQNGEVNVFAMTNNCAQSYIEDFGTGSVGTYGTVPAGQTTYHVLTNNIRGEDGHAKVVSTAYPDFNTWRSGSFFDHTTGNGTGRMYAVNAGYDLGEFFRRRFTGVIPGATYDFSAWVANLTPGGNLIRPNVLFEVVDHYTKEVIASYSTGNINTPTPQWLQYGFSFIPTSDQIDLILKNNSIGGNGNDLAIDDIEFILNPIDYQATTKVQPSCSSSGSITITAPLGAQYEYSIDGVTWGTTRTFTNLSPGLYTTYVRFAATVTEFVNCVSTVVDTLNPSICGTVFNDVNGNTIINAGEGVVATPTPMYVYLVNASGIIVDSARVDAQGNYELSANPNASYTVHLSTVQYPVGHNTNTTPINTTPPSGWATIGENGNGLVGGDNNPNGILPLTVNTSNNINQNFALAPIPVADNKSYIGLDAETLRFVPTNNTTYPNAIPLNNVSGSMQGPVSLVDGTMPGNVTGTDYNAGFIGATAGANNNMTFVTNGIVKDPNNPSVTLTNTVLVYTFEGQPFILNPSPSPTDPSYVFWNSTEGQYEIPQFNPNNLQVWFDTDGQTGFTFEYAWINQAGVQSNNAAFNVNATGPLAVLPVELVYFTATNENCNVVLNWKTASEKNNDYFTVHRSTNGTLWEIIGTVDGNGNSSTPIDYSFMDTPNLSGEVYYRLNQVDYDGMNEWLPIRSVNMKSCNQTLVKVFPNPASEILNIQLLNANIQAGYYGVIELYNVAGSLIMSESLNGNNLQKLNVQNLESGTYMLRIQMNDNSSIFKIVISH